MAEQAERDAGGGPVGHEAGAVLVTGGTGTLGRHVVRELLRRVHPVRVLSRRPRPRAGVPEEVRWCRGDLVEGTGLDAAVAGAHAVVNCASDTRHLGRSDEAGMQRLIDALRAARPADAPAEASDRGPESRADGGAAGGSGHGPRRAASEAPPHLVHVSIVGIDRVPFGYYRRKLAVERAVEASGLPWTVLRATQFHDLVESAARALARVPVIPVPTGVDLQPVDAGEVAVRLADLAAGPPCGRAADFGGPQVRPLGSLIRARLRAAGGGRRVLLPVPLPGRLGRALRSGALLVAPRSAPGDPAAGGSVTFGEHLARRRER